MAVYTDVNNSQLEEFLAYYDIGELHSAKGIAEGVENSNYLITTDDGPFILTLYEKRVNEADLPFFLGLKDHLSCKGFQCPQPVHMKTGEVIGSLAGRPAAIVSFLDGISVRRVKLEHCHQLGSALADMHLLARDFEIKRFNGLTVRNWRPLFDNCGPEIDSIRDGLGAVVQSEIAVHEGHWPEHLPHGVIHADLFPDNVFFLKNQFSGFIDFYFACNDLLAYDLAICINAWCFENDNSFNVTKARALIEGYVSKRPISQEELQALPMLCRGSALRFLLTRMYDWLNVPPGALVVPKDPGEYITKLSFHQGITDPAAYGIEPAELGL